MHMRIDQTRKDVQTCGVDGFSSRAIQVDFERNDLAGGNADVQTPDLGVCDHRTAANEKVKVAHYLMSVTAGRGVSPLFSPTQTRKKCSTDPDFRHH